MGNMTQQAIVIAPAIAGLIAHDTITGTAPWSRQPTILDDSERDALAHEDDAEFDYWPTEDVDELGYPILTDAELAELDERADDWDDVDDDTAEFLADLHFNDYADD